MSATTLHEAVFDAARRHLSRPAVEHEEGVVSYAWLAEQARSVAATLSADRRGGPPLTALLAGDTGAGHAGLLGILASGHGFVPLQPSWPAERIAALLRRSGAREIVVDGAGAAALEAVLSRLETPLRVLGRRVDAPHRGVPSDNFLSADAWTPPAVGADDVAYLMFTSGSTGVPKGVVVTHGNLLHFLDVVQRRYGLGPEDRFSHMFANTFDLSMFDLFGAWTVGACVCCPDPVQRLLPSGFIEELGITVWFSVPSVIRRLKSVDHLEPGAFPGLRLSLFCGEALTRPLAAAWAGAAPNARLENLYGPTEVTLACTAHRIRPEDLGDEGSDVVPIGAPFSGHRVRVVDGDDVDAREGELAVAGPQVARGYWRDPDTTAARFVHLGDDPAPFYLTGDRVRLGPDGCLSYLGRVDQQIQVRGFRVELGEVEGALRQVSGQDAAVALGWPEVAPGCADGLVGFVTGDQERGAVRQQLIERLPRHLVPTRIEVLDRLPQTGNGKLDRRALRDMLESRSILEDPP